MSDDKDDNEAVIERWRARLDAGTPVIQFDIDEPMEAQLGTEGGLALKFVWAQLAGFETAAVAVAILSPAATRRLKAILVSAENIPDTPPPMLGPQSRN